MLRGLHKLCDKSSWDEALDILLSTADPSSAASRPGGWGEWTPLHLACKRSPPLSIVSHLVAAAPSSCETFDVYNRLPIHYAAEKGLELDILKALRDASVGSLSAVDSEGRTPLHLCLLASLYTGDETQAAATRDAPGIEEIMLMIDEDGTAAKTFDNSGNLPLHYVCDNIEKFSEDVVSLLVDSSPSSVTEGNDEGFIPLHQILRRKDLPPPSSRLVEILLDKEGVAARTLDVEGNLPIHLVCDRMEEYYSHENEETKILKKLVDACPETIVERNAQLLSPVHQLLQKQKQQQQLHPADAWVVTTDQLKLLMSLDDAATVEDNDGRLPLHVACEMSKCSYEIMYEIVSHFGGAASVKSKEGLYPLEILDRATRERAAIREEGGDQDNDATRAVDWNDYNKKSDLLFANHPDILPYQTDTDRLGRFGMEICRDISDKGTLSTTAKLVWTWMCTFPEENDPEGLYLSIIENIIRCIGFDAARKLAGLKGEDAKRPIYLDAADKTAVLLRSFLRFADRYEWDVAAVGSSPNVVTDKSTGTVTVRAKRYDTEGDQEKVTDVIITFHTNREDFQRETELYEHLVANGYDTMPIVPLLDLFDLDRIGTSTETSGDKTFARDIGSQTEYGLQYFRYAYVKPVTVETLEDLLQIGGDGAGCTVAEMMDVKMYLGQVGKSLMCLHENGISYGELTTSDITKYKSYLVFSNLNKATTKFSRKPQYFGSTTFRSGLLPPEMIAHLSTPRALAAYRRYWKPVIDDATTAKTVVWDDDIRSITEHVNAMLPRNNPSKFSDLWDRISRNAMLWKKIQPLKASPSFEDAYDDKEGHPYYVPKCFLPLPCKGPSPTLPYKLLTLTPSIDVWMFALLIFDVCSNGETLFNTNKRGDLVNGDDYRRLHCWDVNSFYARKALSSVDDPLARDLLRDLLLPCEKRPSLADVLDHPFFGTAMTTEESGHSSKLRAQEEKAAIRKIGWDIVAREEMTAKKMDEEEALKEKEAMRLKNEDRWLNERTIPSAVVPKGMRQRMEQSSWYYWSLCLQASSSKISSNIPTSFVLLPYPIRNSGQRPIVSEDDTERATTIGLRFANVLHATTVTFELSRRSAIHYTPVVIDSSSKLNAYSQMNRSALAYAETNVVDICEGIMTRAKNAEIVLAEVLALHGIRDAEGTAKKLVGDELAKLLDMNVCQDIVEKAQQTGKAFTLLISSETPPNHYTQHHRHQHNQDDAEKHSKQLVNEKYESVLGSDFCSKSISYKISVERVLFGLIKDFTEDALAASRTILRARVDELVQCLVGSNELNFYLLDEMSCCPMVDKVPSYNKTTIYPRRIPARQQTKLLRFMIPCLFLSMKSNCCSRNNTRVVGKFGTMMSSLCLSRLASMVGLPKHNLPMEWASLHQLTMGVIEDDLVAVTMGEWKLFHEMWCEAMNRNDTVNNDDKMLPPVELFRSFKRYLDDVDPDKDLAELYRMSGPDGLVLWTAARESNGDKEDYDTKNLDDDEFTVVKNKVTSRLKIWYRDDDEDNDDSSVDTLLFQHSSTIPTYAPPQDDDVLPGVFARGDPMAKSQMEYNSINSRNKPAYLKIVGDFIKLGDSVLSKQSQTPTSSVYKESISKTMYCIDEMRILNNVTLSHNLSTPLCRDTKEKRSAAPSTKTVASILSLSTSAQSNKQKSNGHKKAKSLTLTASSAPTKYMQKLLSTTLSPEGTARVMWQSSHARSSHAQSSHAQSSHAQSSHAQSFHAQSSHAQLSHAQSSHAQSTYCGGGPLSSTNKSLHRRDVSAISTCSASSVLSNEDNTLQSELCSAIDQLRARRAVTGPGGSENNPAVANMVVNTASKTPMRKLAGSLDYHKKLMESNLDDINNILDSPTGGASRDHSLAIKKRYMFSGFGDHLHGGNAGNAGAMVPRRIDERSLVSASVLTQSTAMTTAPTTTLSKTYTSRNTNNFLARFQNQMNEKGGIV